MTTSVDELLQTLEILEMIMLELDDKTFLLSIYLNVVPIT